MQDRPESVELADDDLVAVTDASSTDTISPPHGRRVERLQIAILAALAAVLALVVYLTIGLAGARSDVDDLEKEIAILHDDIVDADARAAELDQRLSDLDTWLTTVLGSPPADGDLPLFDDTTNDLAVAGAMTLATIEGTEYYTSAQVAYAPESGTGRVWLVWAHWCPYCQSQLLELTPWYTENAERFPHAELVTVTTAIDETLSNPLIPYLDESAFPFPVIVDSDNTLASRFGLAAFPFWVVTDGDGTVLLRIAGLLDMAQVEELFTHLEDVATGE